MSKAFEEGLKGIIWNHTVTPQAPKEERGPRGPMIMPDIAEFVAPGKVLIGSRSKLREYERSTGTRQCGELNKVEDYAPPPPKVDQRRLEESAYRALQRVLG